MDEKGMFVTWGSKCMLCKCPETIDHVFIEYWDALLFWDVLKKTFKNIHITPYPLHFLPIRKESVPYDMLIIIGLYSIWQSRMTVRHADLSLKAVHSFFLEII